MSRTLITLQNAQQLVSKAFPDVPYSHVVDIAEVPTKESFWLALRAIPVSLQTD
jgi:hypothetical protein